jgi:hypothetical protein
MPNGENVLVTALNSLAALGTERDRDGHQERHPLTALEDFVTEKRNPRNERMVAGVTERRPDGQRTFRVPPGEPLPTSYGHDLYRSIFGTADQAAQV